MRRATDGWAAAGTMTRLSRRVLPYLARRDAYVD
jgi:hypothetical protein